MKEKKTSTDSTWERLKQTLSSRGIVFTAASTLITHVVYIGFNYLSCIFIQYCRVRSGEIGWLERCIYNYRHDGANYLADFVR